MPFNKLRRDIAAYIAPEGLLSQDPFVAVKLLGRALDALGGPVDDSKNPMRVSEANVLERVVERLEDKGRRVPTCVDGSCSLPGQLAPVSSGVGVVGDLKIGTVYPGHPDYIPVKDDGSRTE